MRNARLLDYPLEQSIRSVLPVCDEFLLSVGNSDDDTLTIAEELVKTHPKIRLIISEWDTGNRKDGSELSRQTNQCLKQCRGAWAFYIQADEVLHEAGLDNILQALSKAHDLKQVDALVFDYLHFYGDYRHTITGRSWYRREARIIRTGRGISSFRDAQGFRNNGSPVKAIRTGATLFHYGYVRTPHSLRTKALQMSAWWESSPGSDYRLRRHVGIRPFRGTHPLVMRERVVTHPNDFDPKAHPRVWDRKELKDLVTLLWEGLIPYRIGEFKNYRIVSGN